MVGIENRTTRSKIYLSARPCCGIDFKRPSSHDYYSDLNSLNQISLRINLPHREGGREEKLKLKTI